MTAPGHERCQCHLGGVRFPREHRLTEYGPSEHDAVQPAHQASIDPGFDAVGESRAVECPVGIDHRGHDPRARLAGPLAAGASQDHRVEVSIEPDFAARIGQETPERLSQRPVQLEFVREKDHARIRAPPQDRLAFTEPGEDPARIGALEAVHVESSAGGEEAGGWLFPVPRLGGIGKRVSGLEPGQVHPLHCAAAVAGAKHCPMNTVGIRVP
jgi:hypothetical protein